MRVIQILSCVERALLRSVAACVAVHIKNNVFVIALVTTFLVRGEGCMH